MVSTGRNKLYVPNVESRSGTGSQALKQSGHKKRQKTQAKKTRGNLKKSKQKTKLRKREQQGNLPTGSNVQSPWYLLAASPRSL